MAKEVACALGGLRAELHAARGDNATLSTYVDELQGEVEVLQAANEGMESEADKNSEKLKAKAAEAARYRAELVFNENRLSELEEKFQDYDDDVALSANSKARKQAEADQDRLH